MASSKVSYMLASLLLVLVLADMDKALGEQIQLRNRKLIVSFTPALGKGISKIFGSKYDKSQELTKYLKKAQEAADAIPPPPPSPACDDDVCKGKLSEQIQKIKKTLDKQIDDLSKKVCKPYNDACKRKSIIQINYVLKKACKPNYDYVCKINLIKEINDFLKKAKSPRSP